MRVRRVVKWGGMAASLVLMLLWAATEFWDVSIRSTPKAGYTWWLGFRYGVFYALHAAVGPAVEPPGFHWHRHTDRDTVRDRFYYGFSLPRTQRGLARHRTSPGPVGWRFSVVPLWAPLLALGVPAFSLWWVDRRRFPSGHCRGCGYDLTGNVSGSCPECGAVWAPDRGRGANGVASHEEPSAH